MRPLAGVATPPYRVQVGDVLGIRLFLTPDLDEDVTVRPDGRISTSLVEALPAAGRTPEEIGADLRSDYAHELRDPRLTVEVKTPSPVRIYVSGEVVYPGEFTTAGPWRTITILSASPVVRSPPALAIACTNVSGGPAVVNSPGYTTSPET
jgi:polysaccharide export outer membrane protein